MMRRTLFCLLGIALLASSCGPNREKAIKTIEEHEQAISTLDMNTQDEDLTELVGLYTQFAKDFAEDSLAPVYMLRASELCISLGRTEQAVGLLDSVINLYPGFEDLGGCWFMKGYAYENAERFDEAREAYNYFVENYPEHYLAADTRKTLPYLGMTAEEMFEAIMGSAEEE